MPRPKNKINKSQAIRDFIKSDPKAGPKAIQEGLAKRGINVSAALVSVIKYRREKPANGRRRKAPRRTARSTSAAGNGFAISQLLAAKELANKLGGVSEARKALDLLEQLQS